MKLHIAITFLMLPIIFAFNKEFVNLAISYFQNKNTFFVCVLTCNDLWLRFPKSAFRHNMTVTGINLRYWDKKEPDNIHMCLNQTPPSIGVLIDSKCPSFESVLTYASKYILFDSIHKWFILHDAADEKGRDHSFNSSEMKFPFLSLFNGLNLSVNSDIVIATKTDIGHYNLYDVYNFGTTKHGQLVVDIIGNWDIVNGLHLTTTSEFYRRFDFRQLDLNLILVMSPPPKTFDPEMILTWSPASNVPVLTHTSFIFLHEIANIHNIRFNYTVVDFWIGDYSPDHDYSNSNSIYFHQQDITPAARFLPSHFDQYDVAFPVSLIQTSFFYKIPSHGIGKFEDRFLKPLKWEAWLAVVGILILCGLVLFLVTIVEGRRPSSLVYSIFSVLALICQQFFEEVEDLRFISSVRKLTILVTGVFCVLTYNYYTSSVVSWLLNAPPPSINSLWELLDSPLQPVFQDTGFTYSWLQLPDYYFNTKYAKAEYQLKKKALDLKKKGMPILKLAKDGISLVKEGGYVYHGEIDSANKIIAETFNQRELCDLGSLQSMEKTLAYISVQKKSAYKEFFKWSSLRLTEAGILNRIHRRTLGRPNKCELSSPQALALGGAAPAFIVLAVGYMIAIVIMLIERLVGN